MQVVCARTGAAPFPLGCTLCDPWLRESVEEGWLRKRRKDFNDGTASMRSDAEQEGLSEALTKLCGFDGHGTDLLLWVCDESIDCLLVCKKEGDVGVCN